MPQLALLLTTLIWGATFPATKAVLEQIPPLSFLVLRFLTGALCAWAVLAMMGVRLHRDRQTLKRSAIATIWLFCGYVLQTVGLQYTSASNSAFITALYVIFVPLFLGRFQPRIWATAVLALIGLWCLIDPTVVLNLGDLMTLGCAAAFAAHIVCLESYSRLGDPRSFFVWQLLMVTGVLMPMMWVESPGAERVCAHPGFGCRFGRHRYFCHGRFCRSGMGATTRGRATRRPDLFFRAGVRRLVGLVLSW